MAISEIQRNALFEIKKNKFIEKPDTIGLFFLAFFDRVSEGHSSIV